MATFNRRGYKNSKSNQIQKGEKSQTAEVFESLDSTANKSEQWILKNQKIILTIIALISVSVLSYIGYERLISDPNEKEAISELNKAQYFFELALVSNESDSLFKLALNGGEGKYGFLDIVKEYSGTKASNLANYSIGMSYLNLKEYDNAIIYLEKFKSDDILLKSISLGTIGDCFSELNQPDEAFEYYQKAFKHNENIYTTPKYLFKAALIGSEIGKYRSSIDFLNRIKDEFPDSYESSLVEVQLGRIENLKN
ncbi:MAG: tetratricopeptide repeat protein [Flavobacteriales bacterium]|jgi:tetratricopeptide (TPR) repeat protein|nr:tetratricopeptide repeat protein [Flavobacteriales bacterium]